MVFFILKLVLSPFNDLVDSLITPRFNYSCRIPILKIVSLKKQVNKNLI